MSRMLLNALKRLEMNGSDEASGKLADPPGGEPPTPTASPLKVPSAACDSTPPGADPSEDAGARSDDHSPSRSKDTLEGRPQRPSSRSSAAPLPQGLEESLRSSCNDRPLAGQYRRLADNLLAPLEARRAGSMAVIGLGDLAARTEMIAQLGLLLADRGWGDALLVDANLDDRALTARMGAAGRAGLAEVLRDGRPWAGLLTTLASAPLRIAGKPTCGAEVPPAGCGRDGHATNTETIVPAFLNFLPAGAASCDGAGEEEAVDESLWTSWEQSHNLVLVDGGDARRPAAAAWSRLCEAAYIVVPLGEFGARAVTAAVAQLRAADARLRGCIVTGAPADA